MGNDEIGQDMIIPLYQVDAFATELFRGNPAAVCLLEAWLDDAQMLAIAAENNLSETAFLVRNSTGFEIRWFTPLSEVAFCGHATLASAFVLYTCMQWPEDKIVFHTRRSGIFTVTPKQGRLEMDLPATHAVPITPAPELAAAIGVPATQVYSAGEDLMVVLEDEAQVIALQPNMGALAALPYRGLIVTAAGTQCDFVSRFFAPRFGIPEDPVTGSAHCALTPYWARALDRTSLHAKQLSSRGGDIFCRDEGERIKIAGTAVLYLQGTIAV